MYFENIKKNLHVEKSVGAELRDKCNTKGGGGEGKNADLHVCVCMRINMHIYCIYVYIHTCRACM